jgi:hypothetical protein
VGWCYGGLGLGCPLGEVATLGTTAGLTWCSGLGYCDLRYLELLHE